ncbi:MAG: LCP family protein [Patescibacteria group bacterium]|jgi:LCP family protein required for cell wall assembly
MRTLKINFLENHGTSHDRGGANRPVRSLLSLAIFAGLFAFSFGIGRLSLSESASAALATIGNLPIISQMQLIVSSDRKMSGEAADRINILLLGMGGEGHDGPLLTDTNVLLSLKPSTGQVALMSIPRDLLVPLPKYGWRKINAANAFGELEAAGRGADLSRTALEGLFGMDIPYYVRIDFNGFKEIVDDLGGIDVYIDKSFADHNYPTADHGVQTISFTAGWQNLSGEEALKYTRSRHGNNGEGSDFARAKRQQKVLAAIKEKAMTFQVIKNPAMVSNLLASLQSNIATNLQVGEILRLAKFGRSVDPATIVHKVIDDRPGSPLVASQYGGAYVLVPRNDDWTGLRELAADIFSSETDLKIENQPARTAAAADAPNEAKPRIEILNGSGETGLARDVAGKLTALGFTVVRIGNADTFAFEKTLVYDLTDGKMKSSITNLKEALNNTRIDTKPSQRLIPADRTGIDIVVILGKTDPKES